MFQVDLSDAKKLDRFLQNFAQSVYPRINGAALNKTAYEARLLAQQTVRRRFITRNKWTENSIKYERVKGFNPATQASYVGSIQPYLEKQEFGGIVRKTGKHGVDIPTKEASGEGRGSGPRRRVVRRALRRGAVKVKPLHRMKTKKQSIFVTIKTAKTGDIFYLPFDRHPGLYRKRKGRIDLIRDFSKQAVVLSRRPWLKPTVDRMVPKSRQYFIDAARRELSRLRLV